ncbi:MAG TPA: FkbM family methyltransferase [Candidatus Babeliales bacterium]|jgi:FkbM family methyltransferase|nr:FkbM family methyltransferase [Candidatus Babeliales bacterium]
MIIFKSHEALHHIAAYLPFDPIIVEAGAFTGSDSIKMVKQWPRATVHAFEPVPELYEQLKHNTQAYTSMHTYQYALSNQNGYAEFYVSEKPDKPGKSSQAGSLHAPKERLAVSSIQFPHTITVPTITLDAWASCNTIDHVDLLWFDMQGHELAVLQASNTIIKTVKVIYTEVAFIQAYHGQPTMQQIIDFLTNQGFALIGRDFVDTTKHFFGNLLFARI